MTWDLNSFVQVFVGFQTEFPMIDLHTHSILSDGELLPSELARRAHVKGYRIIGISDHADSSNMEFVISAMLKLREEMEYYCEHHDPARGSSSPMCPERPHRGTDRPRRGDSGHFYVVVHGETLVEPVEEGHQS